MNSSIILAGGLGTRLRAAVPDVPKPMAPIGGRPFLEYQLDYWIAQGIGRFVLSVGYRHETITSHFGYAYRGAELDYAIETTPLGTGGGLLLAMERVPQDRPFLLLNGDTYFEVDFPGLCSSHLKMRADVTVALFRTSDSGRYMGITMSADGRITSLKSAPEANSSLANGGVYWVDPVAVRSHARRPGRISFEDDILPSLLTSGGRLFGIECEGRFIDIGVPEDYRRASGVLL